MYRFLRDLCKLISFIIFRVKIEGKENIPEGPFVIVANHLSILDPIIISFITDREIHFMAKAELFRNKFTKFLFESVNCIKVERGTNDVMAIKKSLKVLKNGGILGIFPEGTRRKEKIDNSAKSGAVLIAHRSNVNILPISISSTYKLFSRIDVKINKVFNVEDSLQKYDNYENTANKLLDGIYEGVDIN